jgi:hypothetical protein
MMVEISLTAGEVALVDMDDALLVKPYHWYLKGRTRGYRYAVADVWHGGKKTHVSMHRLITGAMPGQDVDHINRDGLDNRRSNLRLCTRSENNANSVGHVSCRKSRFKGVCLHKGGRWAAYIRGREGHRYLGLFDREVDAAHAYNCAALASWGQFARLNDLTSELPCGHSSEDAAIEWGRQEVTVGVWR